MTEPRGMQWGTAGSNATADLPPTLDENQPNHDYRRWQNEAVGRLLGEANRSADTHLLRFPLPVEWNIDLYLKDESTHPTGSLKHRLARSLFLLGLVNGRIKPDLPVIEASSGSTAVSEAYFAALIGVPFIAVVPRSTSPEKVRLIEHQGGSCHFVDSPGQVYLVAEGLATETGGYYLDQFTNAERATDWRGNNNIAESLFQQLSQERHPEPAWVVTTAGTGGTSATIGRYLRYTRRSTRLCVADPENSCFFGSWAYDTYELPAGPSRIEGIGRPREEPSFLPQVIDRMMRVPDPASLAAMRALETALSRRAGGSTGTGLWAAFRIVAEMLAAGVSGSVVTLICDSGDRYLDTYYSDEWVAAQQFDLAPYAEAIDRFLTTGAVLP